MKEALFRDLGSNFRRYLMPHIERWTERAVAEGVSEDMASAVVAIEALILSSVYHVGSDEFFVDMARVAIEESHESPPTEH